MPTPFSHHWTLDPEIAFLNHGSFGACPTAILQLQQELRARLESEPVRFFHRELEGLREASRRTLAQALHAAPADVVFVTNATSGVNAVMRALRFSPDDELLVTDHAYGSCRNIVEYAARRAGAKLVVARLPFPVETPAQLLEAILRAVTSRTRLAMIDHITSGTALLLPIRDIVRALDERGIDTLVDGAHALGMVPLDTPDIGAAYYAGNCHKWLCAPKGAGFLHVRPDRQEAICLPNVGQGYNAPGETKSPFQRGFDWPGTFDPTPWLCVGACVEWCGALLPGGLAELRRRNHDLVVQARDHLCAAWGTAPPCPPEMLGSMATVAAPGADPADLSAFADGGHNPLQEFLFRRHRIQVPVIIRPESPQRYVRLSAQAYNSLEDYQKLAAVWPGN